MASRRSHHVRRTLLNTVGWTFAGVLFGLLRYVGLEGVVAFDGIDLSSMPVARSVLLASLAGGAFGLLSSFLEPLLDRPAIRKLPYGRLILLQTCLLITLMFSVVVVSRWLQLGDFGPAFLGLFSVNFLVIAVYTAIVSGSFAFLRQVDRKFGPGNLVKLLAGRYYEPRPEQRIFMFLDLRSSTTLAERLGHVQYSRLIQDCFRDLAVVLEDRAEVYQYVGDEAVLCWQTEPGLKDANCLRAFFRFDDQIRSRAEYYEAHYGEVPVFKAGGNIGEVTVAEVGEIKREIAFHGDVLNTAARIQARCNELGQRMLISEYLVDALGPTPGFVIERLGNVELRGRSETVDIFSVQRT